MLDNSYLYTVFVAPEDAESLAPYFGDNAVISGFSPSSVNLRQTWQRAVATSMIAGLVATGAMTSLASGTMAASSTGNGSSSTTTVSSNSNVRYVQTLLANSGFNPGPIDGVAGKSTKNAILRAQQKFGLTPDGIAGSATIAALEQQATASQSTIVIAQASRADVVNLQKLLTDRGFYDGAIDGVMGPRTRAAVVAAQKKYGLTADGVAGPKTLAALESGSSTSGTGTVRVSTNSSTTTTTTTTAARNDVRRLQELLAKRGFYKGTVDGISGRQTRDAVIAAQRAYGLTADGVAGPRTIAALENSAAPSNTTSSSSTTSSTTTNGTTTQTNNQTTVIRGSNTTRTNTNTTNTRSSNDGDSNVRDLQALLSDRGFYTGAIDGVMGQDTTNAVIAAQKKYGLVADGVAGPLTLAALENNAASAVTPAKPKPATATAATTPAANPTSNEDIANLQNLLTDRGFYNGPITGVTGPSTRNAVIAAQKAYGLNPDGTAGPDTIAALEANQRPTTSAPAAKPVTPTPAATTQPKPAATPAATAQPKPSTKPVVAAANTTNTANNTANAVAPGGEPQVLELQRLLAKRGFYNGQANGVLNGETRNAIVRAQNFYAVNPADGTPSQALVENLSKDTFVADN
jgi:peptidoglycan hydrolase-like protein with peptidoglycan-binding domain